MTADLVLTADTAIADSERLAYECPVPHIPQAVGLVRRRVTSLLTEWAVPDEAADEVVLVVSELVTNAVVHARPPAALRLSYGHRLRVEVRDQGAAAEDVQDLSEDEHGRGCAIVSLLAANCGAYKEAGECVRWAEFDAR
ncbi:ATP-binding protein [Streptomyces sp. UG1]|uniref:ATP-binding protein n=1 Tax=Streptomyces sp. UG1 TaxID=3417652 RepID=UPI003CF3EFA4